MIQRVVAQSWGEQNSWLHVAQKQLLALLVVIVELRQQEFLQPVHAGLVVAKAVAFLR
jgi:hypothetical protein